MIICLCKSVSDRDIRQLVAEGASTLRDVRTRTGAMTQCGRCACHTRDLLKSLATEIKGVQTYSAVA